MGRGIRFTTEFKREAVRLVLSSGRPQTEIAEDLGVGLSSLTRWIGQYRGEEMPPEIKDDLQATQLPQGAAVDVLLLGRAIIKRDLRDRGEDHQDLDPQHIGHVGRGQVLVDHSGDTVADGPGAPDHRDAAANTGNHHRAAARQLLH